jgi:hypothetical protein
VNAAELYEIVKDVPREVKTNLYYDPLDRCWREIGGDQIVNTALAEAAFVGSMVLYLIGKGYHVHGWDSNSDTSTATLVLYDREFSVSTDKYRGMGTIVALLAAACKEARP